MWGDPPKKNETQSNSDFDHMAGAALALAVVCIAALYVAQYVPIALVGGCLGFFISTSRFQPTRFLQIKTALRNIAFLALLYFIGFGFPVRSQHGWIGALFYSNDFWQMCISIAQGWNEFVPHQKFLNSLRLLQISALLVTHYVWLSFYTALGFSFSFYALGSFGKLRSEVSEITLQLVSLPSLFFLQSVRL